MLKIDAMRYVRSLHVGKAGRMPSPTTLYTNLSAIFKNSLILFNLLESIPLLPRDTSRSEPDM
jgi:hypothetical protein